MPAVEDDSSARDDDRDAPRQASWEDDENRSTLFLRALFTLLAGIYLLWASQRAALDISSNWNRWIALAAIGNALLPLGIVWFFFGQGLRKPPWLRAERHNAWGFGWNFRHWKQHALLALMLWALMLPLLVYFSKFTDIRSYYAGYFPPVTSTPGLLWLLVSLVFYMLCWEWFFRGFLLFGMAQGFGFVTAIILQALLFGAAHVGKPPLEMLSSFFGGAVLGVLCWREKSFAPAFYTHALIHLSWALLLLR